MMTFWEYLESEVKMYGVSANRRKDTSRKPGRLGVLFKAVNPADLGMSVVWNMNAAKMGHKKRKSGIVGRG